MGAGLKSRVVIRPTVHAIKTTNRNSTQHTIYTHVTYTHAHTSIQTRAGGQPKSKTKNLGGQGPRPQGEKPEGEKQEKKQQHSPNTLRNIQSAGLAQPSHYLEAQMKGKYRCPDPRWGPGAGNGSGGGGGGGGQ